MTLPRSLDDLRGKRAARWLRESTAGQADHFGPDAQRRQQDEAIERYGLVDTGVGWDVAHSGRTAWQGPEFAAMLESAGVTWDVLVVGYVSRFLRNVKQALIARDDLHDRGAVLLFVDERILSSDEDRWDEFVRESHEAESYSRKLAKRIREGYAAKRRRLADPGGHPPFGFRRVGPDHVLEVDPARVDVVQRAFALAEAGETDRAVGEQLGIGLYTVREMLRNPVYAGRLRGDGTEARFAAPIDEGLWHRVQEVRERRSTRDGRPAKRRPYALSMLRCGACGRRLTGDTGRYRHPDVCPEFAAAAPPLKRRARGQHREPLGRSYPAELYEGAVREVLGRISLGADVVSEVVGRTRAPAPDGIAAARVDRERDAALARYRRDRDQAALVTAMARLDAEEQAAKAPATKPALEPAVVVDYLRNLPTLWDDAPAGRRALVEFLISTIRVIGIRSISITPTPVAVEMGFLEAFQARTAGNGRGERNDARPSRLIVRLVPGVETRIRLVLPPAARLRIVERSA